MLGLQGCVAQKPSKAGMCSISSQKKMFIAVLSLISWPFWSSRLKIMPKVCISAKLLKACGNLQGFTNLLAMHNGCFFSLIYYCLPEKFPFTQPCFFLSWHACCLTSCAFGFNWSIYNAADSTCQHSFKTFSHQVKNWWILTFKLIFWFIQL